MSYWHQKCIINYQQFYQAVDRDSDGYLGKDEFKNFTGYVVGYFQQFANFYVNLIFRSISDGNRERLFTNLDKDKNGKIDLDEFRALFKK